MFRRIYHHDFGRLLKNDATIFKHGAQIADTEEMSPPTRCSRRLSPLDDRHVADRPAASISFLAEADSLETTCVLV